MLARSALGVELLSASGLTSTEICPATNPGTLGFSFFGSMVYVHFYSDALTAANARSKAGTRYAVEDDSTKTIS